MTAAPVTVWGPYPKPGSRYSLLGPMLSRDGVVVHTYESTGDTLPLSRVLANLATPGTKPTGSGRTYGTCYHAFPRWPEGPAGEYHEALDERHVPYAAGIVPGQRFLHFCLWGRAGQTREQWLDAGSYPQLQALARYIADKSVIHGFPIVHVETVGPNWGQTAQHKANAARVAAPGKIGVLGHRDVTGAKVWGGTHGDPGINFPWSVVLDLAHQHLQGDDMARLIATPGDPAAFTGDGFDLRHIEDWDDLVYLWEHGLVAKEVTTVERADLARFHLHGPDPFTTSKGKSSIKGDEFKTWVP